MHIPHAYIISSRRRATTSLMRWPVKQALVYRPVRWLVKHTLVYRPTLWLVSQALGSMERRPWRRRRPCHPCQSLTNSNIRRAIDRPPFIGRTHPIARVHGNEASDLSVIPCPLPLYCFSLAALLCWVDLYCLQRSLYILLYLRMTDAPSLSHGCGSKTRGTCVRDHGHLLAYVYR